MKAQTLMLSLALALLVGCNKDKPSTEAKSTAPSTSKSTDSDQGSQKVSKSIETTKVEVENSDETEDALINEMTLPRNVLSMFKPMFQQVLNGSKTLAQLEAYGKIITDERAKVWFKQQLKQLAGRFHHCLILLAVLVLQS